MHARITPDTFISLVTGESATRQHSGTSHWKKGRRSKMLPPLEAAAAGGRLFPVALQYSNTSTMEPPLGESETCHAGRVRDRGPIRDVGGPWAAARHWPEPFGAEPVF